MRHQFIFSHSYVRMATRVRRIRRHKNITRRRPNQRGAALMNFFKTAPEPLCQCPRNKHEDVCRNQVVPGTVFCSKHQNCRPPPLSGDELPYNPDVYNKDPAVRKTHNCLSYALGIVRPQAVKTCRRIHKNCRRLFQQPGNVSGRRNMNRDSRLRCSVISDLLLNDYPMIKKSSFYGQCPANHYKIASVVDKGNDHHWYRQHHADDAEIGSWSHKSGEQDVTNQDAQGNPIFNPKQASRDYTDRKNSNLNYEDFCGFFCVPRGLEGPSVSRKVVKEMQTMEEPN